MNKKLVKRFVIFDLVLAFLFVAGFYIAPYLQARWVVYKAEKSTRETLKATSQLFKDADESIAQPESSPAAESQAADSRNLKTLEDLKEASGKLEAFREKNEKIMAPYMASFQEPGFLSYLQSIHQPPRYPTSTYCFYAPPKAPSLEEVQAWVATSNPADLYKNAKEALLHAASYEGHFHQGDQFAAYADYLKRLHPTPLQPKLFYRSNFYRFLNKIRKSSQPAPVSDPAMEKFIEANSRFLTNKPALFSMVLPEVERSIFEREGQEILQGFQNMISTLGVCKDPKEMKLSDLIASNECYRHAEKWLGSYVSAALAERITHNPGLYSIDVKADRLPESMKYSVEILGNQGGNKKAVEMMVNYADVGLPAWVKTCQSLKYASAKRTNPTPAVSLIQGTGGAWTDETLAQCSPYLWEKVEIKKLPSGLLVFRTVEVVPTWFWDSLGLTPDDWVVKVNGEAISPALIDQMKQSQKWLVKEGLQLEVMSSAKLLAAPETAAAKSKKKT